MYIKHTGRIPEYRYCINQENWKLDSLTIHTHLIIQLDVGMWWWAYFYFDFGQQQHHK